MLKRKTYDPFIDLKAEKVGQFQQHICISMYMDIGSAYGYVVFLRVL